MDSLVKDSIQKMCPYKWYVDGILVTGDKSEAVNRLFKEINTSQKHIPLKCEKEMNNLLPFLDIMISRRDDGLIKRSVHRNSTWTEQSLNFHSYCPTRKYCHFMLFGV